MISKTTPTNDLFQIKEDLESKINDWYIPW